MNPEKGKAETKSEGAVTPPPHTHTHEDDWSQMTEALSALCARSAVASTSRSKRLPQTALMTTRKFPGSKRAVGAQGRGPGPSECVAGLLPWGHGAL